jgi:hypothetical protein
VSLLIIVGAGASYDSYATYPPEPPRKDHDRLPLADELFASREEFEQVLERFPDCLPLVTRLRHLEGVRTIEEEFERLQSEATDPSAPDPVRVRQLAAIRFYIQAVIDACEEKWYPKTKGITNYLTLLDDVRRLAGPDVSIVTFNYDRLIERAIERLFGCVPISIDHYLTLGPYSLFKVHGSINWGRAVENHNTFAGNDCAHITKCLIDGASTLKPTQDFYLVTKERPPIVRYDTQLVLLPAIAVPIQTKESFECPETHLDLLEQRLSGVDRILTVGWRGMDRHFLKLLKENLRRRVRIQIVAGGKKDAEQVAANISQSGFDAVCDPRSETFSTYVIRRVGLEFLTHSGRLT